MLPCDKHQNAILIELDSVVDRGDSLVYFVVAQIERLYENEVTIFRFFKKYFSEQMETLNPKLLTFLFY